MNDENKNSLFTYLDKALGDDGIKTTNKIEIKINSKTTLTVVGIGVGLILFNYALGWGIQRITHQ